MVVLCVINCFRCIHIVYCLDGTWNLINYDNMYMTGREGSCYNQGRDVVGRENTRVNRVLVYVSSSPTFSPKALIFHLFHPSVLGGFEGRVKRSVECATRV